MSVPGAPNTIRAIQSSIIAAAKRSKRVTNVAKWGLVRKSKGMGE